MKKEFAVTRGHLGLVLIGAIFALTGCGPSEPAAPAPPPQLRLLTESQYRTVIGDVFGSNIAFAGNFDPLRRTGGLVTVGARSAEVTPAASEEYVRMARQISYQVVGKANRDILVPCKPRSQTAPDAECATRFVTKIGALLYRRPLTGPEVSGLVDTAGSATTVLGDFYDGLGAALVGMLVAPDFLFISDATERDPDGGVRLTAYSKASRLSFFLWNSAPDDALLAAAAKGDLHSASGLQHQVDRMIQSPRVENGVRAFFSDMLTLTDWDHTEKDSTIYPIFNAAAAKDAREQTLRTLVQLLIEDKADYRDIFTTRKTFMTGSLAKLYQVPVARPDGGWMPYEFPAGDPRAGIITQISFAALYSHPERSSPTIRGRAVREVFLCQKVPDPPGNVDFSAFNDPKSPRKTQRQRLAAHASAPTCAGCHKLTDPVGLGMETLDGAGQIRSQENGEAIDVSGSLDGVKYDGIAGLGQVLHDSPAVPSCIVSRLYSYATARIPSAGERDLLKYFQDEFAADGYKFPALLRNIVTSRSFFAVTAPGSRTQADRSNTQEKNS